MCECVGEGEFGQKWGGGDILKNSSYYFKLFLVTYTAPISSSKIMKLNEVFKLMKNKYREKNNNN